jgi:hypothetical protein
MQRCGPAKRPKEATDFLTRDVPTARNLGRQA